MMMIMDNSSESISAFFDHIYPSNWETEEEALEEFLEKYIKPTIKNSGFKGVQELKLAASLIDDDVIEIAFLGGIFVRFNTKNTILTINTGMCYLLSLRNSPDETRVLFLQMMRFCSQLFSALYGLDADELNKKLLKESGFLMRLKLVESYYELLQSIDSNVSITLMKESLYSFYLPNKDILLGTIFSKSTNTLHFDYEELDMSEHNIFYMPDIIINLEKSTLELEEVKSTFRLVELQKNYLQERTTDNFPDFCKVADKNMEGYRFIRTITHLNTNIIFKKQEEILIYCHRGEKQHHYINDERALKFLNANKLRY